MSSAAILYLQRRLADFRRGLLLDRLLPQPHSSFICISANFLFSSEIWLEIHWLSAMQLGSGAWGDLYELSAGLLLLIS